MKRALYITFNEVRLFLQDKGELAFALLLPIVTFALMYGAFGGNTIFTATASIVNNGTGEYSQRLIDGIDAVPGISIDLITPAEAERKLNRSDLLMVIEIPADFSQNLTDGGQSQILFKQRGNGGQEGQILASIVRGVAGAIDQEFQVRAGVAAFTEGTGITPGQVTTAVQQYLGEERQNPTVTVNEETLGGGPDFINLFLPGIITMYVLFTLTLSARTIVEERRRGTLERLLTTRLSATELFLGKYFSATARGFVQTLILLALSYAVFQLFTPLGFLYALVVALLFSAACGALGLVIAAVAKTEDGATWIGVVFTMATVMLGGTFFEVASGSVLAKVGILSINTYANEAFRTIINQGGGLGQTWPQLAVLGGVIVVGFVISRLLFRAVPGGK
jgi:ABC-2 type transport system permease protein